MNSEQTIRIFTEFYRERGHQLITGSTLIPTSGDPVLFTSAGMHPLTPYLNGQPHPLGRRLVNVQRCLRTTDLEEVGDRTHLTVFEMLGSWSLGDYSGPQSLRWGYELLRDGFGISHDRLKVTVFEPDTESRRVWEELGVPVELLGHEDNWWSNGPTGLCGPDSEIFVWTGRDWVEVWNHVMMRYFRHEDGTLEPLSQSNVDTGMGFERLLTVLQDKESVYECDLFEPWRQLPWELDERGRRLVRDHLRSSIVVVGDGIRPTNTGRGYVLRRLVRRLLTTLWPRSIEDLPSEPVRHTVDHFRLPVTESQVREVLRGEEQRFRQLIERGRSVLSRRRDRGPITEPEYRYLHETHGLPREIVEVLL